MPPASAFGTPARAKAAWVPQQYVGGATVLTAVLVASALVAVAIEGHSSLGWGAIVLARLERLQRPGAAAPAAAAPASCAATLQIEDLGQGCVFHYQPSSEESGQLLCTFDDTYSRKGGCRFNVSALGCAFPFATRLSLAPPPPGCGDWTVAHAVRSAAVAWRLQRMLPRQDREAGQLPPTYPAQQGTWGPQPLGQPDQPTSQQAGPPPPQQLGGTGFRPTLAFRPAPGERCANEVRSAVDLMAWARATGIRRLVVSGDSTTRQFYQRLTTLARGRPETVDTRGQRYAHYELRWEGEAALRDVLWFGPDIRGPGVRGHSDEIRALIQQSHERLVGLTRPAGVGQPVEAATAAAEERQQQQQQQQQQQPEAGSGAAQGPAGTGGQGAAAAGSGEARQQPGEVEFVADLIMGPMRDYQADNLRAYVRDVLGSGGSIGASGGQRSESGAEPPAAAAAEAAAALRNQTAFVLAVCYWSREPGRDERLWPDYRELLVELRRAARHVVILTCPLPPDMEHLDVLRSRNRDLRALARSDTSGGLRLLDAARMLRTVPENATIADHQFHYACTYISRHDGKPGPIIYPQDQVGAPPDYFDAVKVQRDGTCEDPVNFSLWQALFCLLAGGGQ